MRALISALFISTIALAAPSKDDLTKAKDEFRRGTQLYDLGKFLEAADAYQEAFRLTDRPAFLFNIGQAYRLGGKPQDALNAYEGYLRRVPNAPQRIEVEQHIDEVKKQIADEGARAAAEKKATDEKAAAERAAAEKAAAERAAAEKIAAEKVASEKLAAEKAVVREKPKPIYKKWWLWTVVGVVVAGVVVGTAVGVTQSNKTTGTQFSPVTFQ